jgi:dihydropyrimidinase
MAYKGELMVDDSTMFRMLQKAKEVGALVMVHAENGDVISLLQQQLLAEGKTEPYYHAVSRPIDIETEATHRAIKLAKAAGSPIFIVHVSSGEPAQEIRRARASGQPVFAETCPQYLFLDETYLMQPGFEGAKYVCSPPLREKSQQEQLWNAITDGTLQTIGTDHCSFDFKNQKHLGRYDFSKIPNGGNGIEHWIPLLYTYGVRAGKISLNQFIGLISANPAKFMGLYPRKGTIAVGSDADLVLFDPKVEQTITAASHLQGSDYNFYEGCQVQGAARHVLLRGEVIVKNGIYVGSLSQGQFIHAKPFGAAYDIKPLSG